VIVVVLWILSMVVCGAVIFGPYEHTANIVKWPLNLGVFYNSVHRTVWGAAICWVIIACTTNNGGKYIYKNSKLEFMELF
jgi:hypothetical protein